MKSIFPKIVFLVKATQSIHYYRIQNIWISFDSNFHLKNIVLIFWIKLEKHAYFFPY